MNKTTFRLISLAILVASALYTWFVGSSDKPTLFIACLGSSATIATLYVAYQIFLNYSATADIQKKQFELVNTTLEFFIKKHFFVEAGGTHYYSYFTNERLDFLTSGLEEAKLSNSPVLMSSEMFEYLIDLQNKMDHHFFPRSIRDNAEFLRPNLLAMINGEDEKKGHIMIYLTTKDTRFGHPRMNFSNLTIGDFIDKWNYFRITLQGFLNDKLQDKYKIVD